MIPSIVAYVSSPLHRQCIRFDCIFMTRLPTMSSLIVNGTSIHGFIVAVNLTKTKICANCTLIFFSWHRINCRHCVLPCPRCSSLYSRCAVSGILRISFFALTTFRAYGDSCHPRSPPFGSSFHHHLFHVAKQTHEVRCKA
jgi:hypothetical protein